MLGKRLSEKEFSHAYGMLFGERGTVQDCLLKVRSLDQRSLKQAYRRRAQETHPDRAHLRAGQSRDPEEEFRSVVAAYELLKLVQQGAVDVQVVARSTQTSNTPPPKPRAQRPRKGAAGGAADRRSAQAAPGAEAKSRRQRDTQQRGSKTRQHTGGEGPTSSASREDAYQDRSSDRAQAWGRFWQHTSSASKFNPDSDHYFEQAVPARQLPFGQFLYYSGAISWRQLIDALVWQRQQRPMIGQLARTLGILDEHQVQEVLRQRRDSGRYDVKFADYAYELGFLTGSQRAALCGRMKMMQKPIGQYFVDTHVLKPQELQTLLTSHRRHNWRAMQRRSFSA